MPRNSTLLVCGLLVLAAGAVPAAVAGGETYRQPGTITFDANSVDTMWIDGSIAFRRLGDSVPLSKRASELTVAVTGAFAPVKKLELGATLNYSSRDYSNRYWSNASGLLDSQVWGKYRFAEGNGAVWSVGAFTSVPFGDEDRLMGTGKFDPGAFVSGGTKIAGDGFVQGFAGFRINSGFRARVPDDDSGVGGELHMSGKTSIVAGFGGAFPTPAGLTAFVSFTIETERYKAGDLLTTVDGSPHRRDVSGDAYAQVTGGARWALARGWHLQVFAGAGLAGAAPDLQLGAGVVFAP